MSYTAPSTRSTGNLITAAIWNQDIRDNRDFMHDCPSAQVYRTTNQTIANNTDTNVSWDAEIFDSQSLHVAGDPTAFFITNDGVYFMHAMVKWASGVASLRKIRFVVAAGAAIIAQNQMRNASTTQVEMSISVVYRFTTGVNPIRLQAYQNTGSNLDLVSDGTFVPRFGICWIGSGV